MDYAYSLDGSAPLKMGFQIGEAGFTVGGIVALEPAGSSGGVATSSTTSMANAVGVTVDAADGAFVTAQQTDGTNVAREVTIIISPNAVFRALMSGGAAEGTALTRYPATADSTNGLTVTTASIANWASPDFDEGTIWFDNGANVGQFRRVISVSSTVATVEQAFNQDITIGENLLRCPWYPLGITDQLQTTTLLTQADATIAFGTGGATKTIDLELNSVGDSFVTFILDDHLLRVAT